MKRLMRKFLLFCVLGLIVLFSFALPAKAEENYATYLAHYSALTRVERQQALVRTTQLASDLYYQALATPEAQTIYQDILTGLAGLTRAPYELSLKGPKNLTPEEVSAWQSAATEAIRAVFSDHKEFFYLQYAFSVATGVKGGAPYAQYTFYLVDIYEGNSALLDDHLTQVLAQRDLLVARASKEQSEYQKIKLIHDWLVLNNDYGKDNGASHSAVSALLPDMRPVCQGYAEAFMLLMDCLAIGTTYVTGLIDKNGERHGWNTVSLGGEWYFIDVTWDDPVLIGEPDPFNIDYEYFLVPLIPGRTIDKSTLLPAPLATERYAVTSSNVVDLECNLKSKYGTHEVLRKDDIVVKIKSYPPEFGKFKMTLYGLRAGVYEEIPLTELETLPVGKYYFIFETVPPGSFSGRLRHPFEIKQTHLVTFFLNEAGTKTAEIYVFDGEAVPTLPDPDPKAGYEFKGWDQPTDRVTGPLTLRPVYGAKTAPEPPQTDKPSRVPVGEFFQKHRKAIVITAAATVGLIIFGRLLVVMFKKKN